MSISAAFFSTSTSAVLLNASGKNGNVTLPYTQSTIGRVLTFKDYVGGVTNGVSTITFSTFNDDRFENGANLLNLPTKFGQVSLLAGADKKWYQLGGTVAYQQVVSSLAVSSIQGDGNYLTDIPHPTTIASSIVGLGTANYVSTPSLISTVSSYTASAGGISRANLTSTVAGLGRSTYVSSSQLFSTVASLSANASTMIDMTELQSTINGLGTATYVSSATLNANLTSTLQGLGTAGYISSLGTSYSVSSVTISGNATSGAISTNSASLTGFTTSSIMASNYTIYKPSSSTEARYVFSGTAGAGAFNNAGGVSTLFQIQWSDDGSNWNAALTISTSVGAVDRSQVRYLSTNLFGIVMTSAGYGGGATYGDQGFWASVDGKNWLKRGNPQFYDGYNTDLAYNGTQLVANGYGQIKYSTDVGATWLSPANCNWSEANQYGRETSFAIAYNSTTGMMVAGGAGTNSNPTMIKYTTNASTWSNATFTSSIAGLTQYVYDVTLGGTTGSRWVAVGPFGGFYSDDAANWSPCVGLTSGYILDYLPATWTVAYSRPLDRWIVAGYQRLHTSADGITYSANLWSNAIGMDILAKAEWLNGKYYAVGRLLAGCNISTSVISSDNGSNWSGSAITGGISINNNLGYQSYQTKSIAYGAIQRQVNYPVNFSSDGSRLLLNGADYMGAYTKDVNLQSTMVGAGFISTSQLTSTVTGVSTTLDSYVTTTEMQSTVTGLGTAAYLSTFPPNVLLSSINSGEILHASTLNTRRITGIFVETSSLTTQNLRMFDSQTATTSTLLTTDGTSLLIDGNNIGRSYAATATVPSTLSGYTFLSTTQLTSTVTGITEYVSTFVDTSELASTVAGIGSAQYVSSLGLTPTFTSTVAGLGTAGFVSSASFVSSINGISTSVTGASGEFISTIVNNYYNISSLTVQSNVSLYGPSFLKYGVYNGSTFVTIDALTSSMDSYFNQPTIYSPQNYSF